MDVQEQFIAQVQQHAGIIHKILRLYVDDPDDQQDMHQEILLQAWWAYGRFRGDSQFSTWLYRVSLNTVLTFQRKRKRQGHRQELQEWHASHEQQSRKEEKDWLLHAIWQLHEVDRMIITLHLEGYKNPEIAEVVGITINHVNVKLHRIKKALHQTLQTT
jgi:RNA polymerase sigma-70 factor (ECF subfamily)